jgi:hypothetical protein
MKPLMVGHDACGRPVQFSPEEREAHMHVIGSSGSGKSKFMEQMIREDLRNGQGFCLIDPHGTLYKEVLDYASHKVLKRDIVLLDLSKPEFVIGFNPFRKAADGDVSVQVDRRIRATMHAWGVENADQTPTLERTLRLIFTTLLELNLSFQEAQYLIDFNSGELRTQLVQQIASPLIRREWEELEQLKAKDWRSEVLSAKNRLFRLLTSRTLGRFFSTQAACIDLAEIIEQGKILLVNLAPSDDLSGENGRIFGSLLVNEFFEVALRRKAAPGRTLKPYYLYMDEFQTFVGLDVAAMLDQVRKFKLFTVLAHQRFGQLDEDLQDAVLTNCRIKAVFGGLPVEAARMMAQELFIGQLDPMRIKVAIYQTKFWPKYARDKVYGHSTSSGRSNGTGNNESAGSATSSGSGTFFSPQEWFGGTDIAGTSVSSGTSSSSQYGSHSNETDFEGTAESESDVPIMLPVPFQELSSVQYMSTDEQLLLLTAALKEQFGRHCFIKIHHRLTQPLRVPFITAHYTSQNALRWYRTLLLGRGGAVAGQVVDEANAKEHERWNSATSDAPDRTPPTLEGVAEFLGRE